MLRALILFFLLSITLFAKETTISLKLSWLHQFQFAGFYIAKEKGFYKDVGLEVNFEELDTKDCVVDEVLEGKYDFGIGKSSLIIDQAQGKDLVALLGIFQHSPSVLITTNPALKTVKDLYKKRVMVTPSEINSISVKAMFSAEGISQKNITIQPHSFKLKDLIEQKTDAMASYISNEPFILDNLGIKYNVIDPKDYSLDFYGDILFTSRKFLEKNPTISRKFYDATKRGWEYAFSNIKESVQIVFEKYNTQNKSLEHLIYEAEALKKLAYDEKGEFGTLSQKRFDEISDIYKLFKLIPPQFNPKKFIDPLGFAKKQVRVGILAKRGLHVTLQRWQRTIDYLNANLAEFYFILQPLDFSEIPLAIEKKEIDFILINPLLYIQMAHKYNISRIATLQTCCDMKTKPIKSFGSVIFTKVESQINSLEELKGKKIAAVDKNSFGGWILGYETLFDHGIKLSDIEVSFSKTHDNVVFDVLLGKVQAGIVRTDTLESMDKNKDIDIRNFKILNLQTYENFPFFISTKLYPEWPFAKLDHTDDSLSYKVLSTLIDMNDDLHIKQKTNIYGWSIPQDYSVVNQVLKKLRIFPFDKQEITYKDVLISYEKEFLFAFGVFGLIMLTLIYTKLSNKNLKEFNERLEIMVKKRTQALKRMNQKLKNLAQTDELTQIDNRRSFLRKTTIYINLAKRNQTPLCFLSLDIDFFKKINDNYGHHIGDKVLKLFAYTVAKTLRNVDLFGRIGGEEFGICLQNTSLEDAMSKAEDIRKKVSLAYLKTDTQEEISVTVSIGVVEFNDSLTLTSLMKLADESMYKAKTNGRNQIYAIQKKCN